MSQPKKSRDIPALFVLISLKVIVTSPSIKTVDFILCFAFLDVVLTSKHHEGWCNFPSAQVSTIIVSPLTSKVLPSHT